MYVHFALHVHEDKSASKSYGYYNEFSPEGPLQDPGLYLLCSAVNEDIEGPDDTGDGYDVECHRAHDLPSLHCRHFQPLPLKHISHIILQSLPWHIVSEANDSFIYLSYTQPMIVNITQDTHYIESILKHPID